MFQTSSMSKYSRYKESRKNKELAVTSNQDTITFLSIRNKEERCVQVRHFGTTKEKCRGRLSLQDSQGIVCWSGPGSIQDLEIKGLENSRRSCRALLLHKRLFSARFVTPWPLPSLVLYNTAVTMLLLRAIGVKIAHLFCSTLIRIYRRVFTVAKTSFGLMATYSGT